MRDVRKLVAVILVPSAVAWAMPAHAQTEFNGAGQTSEIDCDGGTVMVEGASNTLTIHGPCTGLTLTGAGNKIRIDLAPKSVIRIEGADNEIHWSAPGTARPQVRVTGAGNRVTRRGQ